MATNNQLLLQNYTTGCRQTIALLPFLPVMEFAARHVNEPKAATNIYEKKTEGDKKKKGWIEIRPRVKSNIL